jgi:uncharacterized protein YyaL (SSP411 family)
MVELFSDDRGGFYSTGEDETGVPVRMKDMGDGALPSGNAVAARVLARLSEFYRDPRMLALAENTVKAFSGLLKERPESMPCMLSVVDLLTRGAAQASGRSMERGCRGKTCLSAGS